MRIALISFYFRPDLSAGSFRATVLVESLAALVPPGSSIDVVTTLPNRYHSFGAEAPEREHRGIVTITRIALPPHRSGMIDQSKAFLSFARQVRKLMRGREYDIVFATSSRLMTAALGVLVARRARAPVYLDIRDIFVDTIKDVARGPVALLTRPFFALVERWTIARAARVNLVSRGFAQYFEPRYPSTRFSYFTNGIDDEFLTLAPTPVRAPAANGCITVLYAGNLGEGQGLHAIVPGLAARMGPRVRFLIVGDGGRREALVQALAASGATNVELLPPVARARLIELYRDADVLFLHLNDHEAFKKVLPSKLFEYGALGKPVWAGVSGHAAEFIRSELSNAAVFQPCDVDAAVQAFEKLTIGDAPRPDFVARYARSHISHAMAVDVLSIAEPGR